MALLAVVIVGGGVAMNAVGVPSPYLFAALLIGLIRALAIAQPLELPRRVFVAAQAVTGVTLGTYLQRSRPARARRRLARRRAGEPRRRWASAWRPAASSRG